MAVMSSAAGQSVCTSTPAFLRDTKWQVKPRIFNVRATAVRLEAPRQKLLLQSKKFGQTGKLSIESRRDAEDGRLSNHSRSL